MATNQNSVKTEPHQWLLQAGAECLVWAFPSTLFLYVYTARYGMPLASITHHILIVALVAAAFILVRGVILTLLPHIKTARYAVACLLSTTLLLISGYYAIVIIGLQSWERVPSWRLLETYVHQLEPLLQSIELSPSLVLAALITFFCLLTLAVSLYLSRYEWVHLALPFVRPRVRVVIVTGFTLILGLSTHEFVKGNWVYTGEPLSLSTFPQKWRLQEHALDDPYVAYLTAAEYRAREGYRTVDLQNPPNVVLIVVDALRPSHMSLFGYHRQTTPFLDSLSREVQLHKSDRMHATCGASSCGLLSLASSRYLHQFTRKPITLQEVLRLHGYEAHLVLGGDHTNFYGMRDIYGDVDSYFDGTHDRNYYVNDDRLIVERLRDFPEWNKTPSFFQIHLMSTHGLGLRFLDPTYEPQINYSRPEQHFLNLSDERTKALVNFYDNGVVHADHIIEHIYDILLEKGYLENALIIITADHGEALGEHGQLSHANSVRESVIQIPFVLMQLGRETTANLVTEEIINQIDIAPTVLTEIGAPVPSTWRGMSLLSPNDRRITFFQQRSETGLVDQRDSTAIWKFWTNSRTGQVYAFNLTEDPWENNNLSESLPDDTLQEWRQILAREMGPVYDEPAVPN